MQGFFEEIALCLDKIRKKEYNKADMRENFPFSDKQEGFMDSPRNKKIIQTSVVAIGVNLLLVLFKMGVGVIAGSIAVILDALNNLSDALSSVITIVGTKLSAKAPDKKHPYGYGRIEYITSVAIAVIVLAGGALAMKESIDKIITPQAADYTVVSLVIISAAIVVKIALGLYVKGVGKKINAPSLVASGTDAFFDAVLSAGTLAAALISYFFGISLEGVIGAVISVFFIKTGIQMLIEALHTVIGTRTDPELSTKLKEKINSFEEVNGTYDLALHYYGPSRIIGSAHVEVRDDMTAREIHELTRRIVIAVATEYGVLLTIGVYASNDRDPALAEMKEKTREVIARRPEILQMHGFYVNTVEKSVMFDIIVDFKADAEKARESVREELNGLYPDYRFDIILDSDFSD